MRALGAAGLGLCLAAFAACGRLDVPQRTPKPEPAAPAEPTMATARADAPSAAEPAPTSGRAHHSLARIVAAREHAQRRVLGSDAELLPELPVAGGPAAEPAGDSLPGNAIELEQPPGGDALRHFYQALDELPPLDAAPGAASGSDPEGARKVRIAVYGASGTASDMWTGYLRAYLQARFGDAGPGVVAAARPSRWYRHNELQVSSSGRWKMANPQRKALPDDNRYGLMLQVLRGFATPGDATTSSIAPTSERGDDARIARYEVWSQARPGGGTFGIDIDGEPRTEVDTAADAPATSYQVFDLEPGPHSLGLRVREGEVRLFGVVAESDRSGVVVDTLGFDGARVVAHSLNDEPSWSEQLRRRGYALVLLVYGTNEGFDKPDEPIDVVVFEQEMESMLARLARAAPDASCVVSLPALHATVAPGKHSPAPRIAAIRPIMRRLAHARGCAVYDAQKLIGDAGMESWVQAGLARRDYVHLRPRGNVRYGMAVADALMRGWDEPAAR